MNTFTEIIERWESLRSFADDLGVYLELARGWHKRNSIPGCWFMDIVIAAKARGYDDVTLERVCEIAALYKVKRCDKGS